MTELNKRWRYHRLWIALRNKYHSSSTPIYLIEGIYPVVYEAGYNWVVGYCPTLELAEEAILRLRNELREARRYLGPYSKKINNYYKALIKAEKIYGYDSPEEIAHRAPWDEASNVLRDHINLAFSKMTDQNIPFPYRHIMSGSTKGGHGNGPIIYSIRPIYRL